MLESLETTATTFIKNLAEYEQKQQNRFQENEVKRNEELQKHKEKLDKEHEDKDKALKERERALNERIDEIDNRDNTHVRRELRGDHETESCLTHSLFSFAHDAVHSSFANSTRIQPMCQTICQDAMQYQQ